MTETKKPILSEDWTVVVLGFLIILVTLFAFLLPVPAFVWKTENDLTGKVFAASNLARIGLQFVFVLLIAWAGAILTGKTTRSFLVVFPVLYLLTIIALVLAGNSRIKAINLEAVIFSLSIGLLIGNLFRLPNWFRAVLTTELFVKIGLVLLGTTVIFSDILKAGSLGLIQALIVVLSVWYFAFWICKRMKVDDEMGLMISSAVSICGVSAAIATAGAIKGDPRKLSYVISMVLITAIPMMIFMPYIAAHFNFSQAVTGAWLGGSIDTTGAVVASGTLVGEEALKISTIVKFSQNVLLGLAAFVISVYWTYTKFNASKSKGAKPTLKIIWERFPKFVLGFLIASALVTLLSAGYSFDEYKKVVEPNLVAPLKDLRSWFFIFCFFSIGLTTRFREFVTVGSKPFLGFTAGVVVNVILGFLLSAVVFERYWIGVLETPQ